MQWFARSFAECVNHPRLCMFGIVLADLTLQWRALATFPKTLSSSNQCNVMYPWDFVFNFHPSECFFVFELNFF